MLFITPYNVGHVCPRLRVRQRLRPRGLWITTSMALFREHGLQNVLAATMIRQWSNKWCNIKLHSRNEMNIVNMKKQQGSFLRIQKSTATTASLAQDVIKKTCTSAICIRLPIPVPLYLTMYRWLADVGALQKEMRTRGEERNQTGKQRLVRTGE